MKPLKRVVYAVAITLLSVVTAFAHDRPVAALKDLPADHVVTQVNYCRGQYAVLLGDGSTRRFKEHELAFKTDSSANGPSPAKAAFVPVGRVDRGFLVFANLDELRRMLTATCQDEKND